MRASTPTTSPLTSQTDRTVPISVVIPAYNAAAYLAETVQSVRAQTVRPHEIIVVNDGSSDDTAAVAQSLGVTVVSVENGGPAAARNLGTDAASGTYIAFLDADDLWPPNKLEIQYAALTAFGKPAFSFTDYRQFDEIGVYGPTSGLRMHPAFRQTAGKTRDNTIVYLEANDRRPVLRDMYFLPSSALVKRSDIIAIGGFDSTLRACEDYEFFLRLFRKVPALAIMQPLLLYRRHPTQLSAATIKLMSHLFEIEKRVIAAADRYPIADARYIMGKGFLINYRLGLSYARLGQFDEAIAYLRKSLATRPTGAAFFILTASVLCRSAPGSLIFLVARGIRQALVRRRGLISRNPSAAGTTHST